MVRGPARRCLRTPGVIAAVIVVIGSLGVATRASAQAGTPYLPPGYGATSPMSYVAPTPQQPAPRTTSIRALWIPGLIGLPVAWVSTWVNANISLRTGSDGVNAAYIPLVGPWMVLAAGNVDAAYYIATGVFQDVSFLCFVLGLVIRIPEPRARIALGSSLPPLDVALSPTATGGAMSAQIQF
jgi:hypothetical protein